MAGNLALGVHMGAVKGAKAKRYMEVARGITRTCYEMYNRTATGANASAPLLGRACGTCPLWHAEQIATHCRPERKLSFSILQAGPEPYQEYTRPLFVTNRHSCRACAAITIRLGCMTRSWSPHNSELRGPRFHPGMFRRLARLHRRACA